MNDFIKNSIGEEVDRRNSNISETQIEEEPVPRDHRFSSQFSEIDTIQIEESQPEPIQIIKKGGRKK